ncbi:MAG: flavin reductase family protein [Actinomycetes bacterium]
MDEARCLSGGQPATTPAAATSEPFQTVARQLARGTAVLSSAAGDQVHAVTVSTFGIVSVEPPLVVATVARGGRLDDLVERSGEFAACLLTRFQEPLAHRCATPGRPAHWSQFPAAQWWLAPHSGAPLARGSLAWFDCRLHSVLRIEDRSLLVGAVTAAGREVPGPALVRFDDGYHFVSSRGSVPCHPDGTTSTTRGGEWP